MLDKLTDRSLEDPEKAAPCHIAITLYYAGKDLPAFQIQAGGIRWFRTWPQSDNTCWGWPWKARDENLYSCINGGQTVVVDRVASIVYSSNSSHQRCFLLEGARGIGKTHVYNPVIRMLRLRGDGVTAVVFAVIAATLPRVGSTVHSRFRLPLEAFCNFTSTTASNSKATQAISNAELIVWDQICMQQKYALEAVDRLLRGPATSSSSWNRPFGGWLSLVTTKQLLLVWHNANADDIDHCENEHSMETFRCF